MNVVLHLAISADGFIATPDGDSDWTSPVDGALFTARAQAAGCLVVGRRTFKQYHGILYPMPGVLTIVLTREPGTATPGVLYAPSPSAAVTLAEENGCGSILIAGGGQTSAAFLRSNLIDEIFFSVHPLMLGQGVSVFSEVTTDAKLTLLGVRKLEDELVELHYQIIH